MIVLGSSWVALAGDAAAHIGASCTLQVFNTSISSSGGYLFVRQGPINNGQTVQYSCLAPLDVSDIDPSLTLEPIPSLPSLAGFTQDFPSDLTALGVGAGIAVTSGTDNTAIGLGALGSVDVGTNNTALGSGAGSAYTNESDNICIGYNQTGIAAENTTTRIGVEGTQTACFVAGINGNTITTPDYVTIDTTTGQLGATGVAPAGFSVVQQVFTSSGTYTPTSGMAYCKIEVLGGGGGGGGAGHCLGSYSSGGGGGGSGGYAQGIFSSGTIGASQTVTIGAAGTAGAAGANTGGTGGTSSVGAIISATGGVGGGGGSEAAFGYTAGGVGGAGTGGSYQFTGTEGGTAFTTTAGTSTPGMSGYGANSLFGGGARSTGAINGGSAGNAATNYGSGGGGGATFSTAAAGGVGFKGIVIITEYV